MAYVKINSLTNKRFPWSWYVQIQSYFHACCVIPWHYLSIVVVNTNLVINAYRKSYEWRKTIMMNSNIESTIHSNNREIHLKYLSQEKRIYYMSRMSYKINMQIIFTYIIFMFCPSCKLKWERMRMIWRKYPPIMIDSQNIVLKSSNKNLNHEDDNSLIFLKALLYESTLP